MYKAAVKIPRYNYPAQFPDGIDPLMAELRDMILRGRYVLSSEVDTFEAAFATHTGTRFAKGVNTGTDALAIAFIALGIRPGDEIIIQANTFNATVNGAILARARPVLVDADPQSYLIDSSQIEQAITSRTRAIVPVHLYGKPTPMGQIMDIADKRGLLVVEDAAQAHGARLDGRGVGGFGAAGCFSFHPSKNLAAAGDAGAIVTNDESTAQLVGEVRSLGQKGQNNHVRPGFNSRLDSVQAKILQAKLPHLRSWNQARRKIASRYREHLRELPVQFQAVTAGEEHAYHLFQLRTSRRDDLMNHLIASGVDAVIRYPTPIHLQPAFASYGWQTGQFPVAEALARELICLPIRPDLTNSDVDYVCDSVRSFFT